jgi:hypothetical protein
MNENATKCPQNSIKMLRKMSLKTIITLYQNASNRKILVLTLAPWAEQQQGQKSSKVKNRQRWVC